MRSFKNIATLIRTKRINHPKNYSQSDLSLLLGYKNGQFISNVERGLCNVPLKMMKKISEVLDIMPEDIKHAILKDHEETLTNFFNKSQPKKSAGHDTSEPTINP
jgi:transcriptional regulator with XRE-family HTH domain